MPGRYLAELIARKRFGNLVELVLKLEAPFEADPGQFIHVRCEKEGLILRRPFSLSDVRGDTISIMVREVGAGSAWLCALEIGLGLDIMGPLGRGFTVDGVHVHVLVAGGTGIAPIRFLAGRLKERNLETTIYWGVESEEEFAGLADELKSEFDLRFATIDGGAGSACSVIELLKEAGTLKAESIYACGPRGMLAALAECINGDALAGVQVCMEERMACGIGACRGCVVPASSPGGAYLTACKDGPVFRGRELDWTRIGG